MSKKKQRFLEALLFASEGILERSKIKRFMSLNDGQLDELIEILIKKYETSDSSLKVITTSNSVILTIHEEFVPKIKDFIEAEFSSALLKTLALVAYRSPLTQSEVVKARGNKSYGHVNELLSLGLVQAEDFGKTKMLRLTPRFFKYFNMSKKEFKNVFRDSGVVEVQSGPAKTEKLDRVGASEQVEEVKKEKTKTLQEGDRDAADAFFVG